MFLRKWMTFVFWFSLFLVYVNIVLLGIKQFELFRMLYAINAIISVLGAIFSYLSLKLIDSKNPPK